MHLILQGGSGVHYLTSLVMLIEIQQALGKYMFSAEQGMGGENQFKEVDVKLPHSFAPLRTDG